MVQHVLNYVNKDGNFDSIFLWVWHTHSHFTRIQFQSSASFKRSLNIRRHVQISNEGAIDFYKKFGFEIVETKEHYYKRIEPADAHVLQKTLRPQANQTNHQMVN